VQETRDRKYVVLALCRHTQTDHNAQRIYSGAREDVPLNAVGRAQADVLTKRLKYLRIKAIYSSDLLRARQVADRIAAEYRLTPVYDARLREVDIGPLGTLTKEEARVRFPDERYRTSSLSYDFSDIGGEMRSQVIARQELVFREILEAHGSSISGQDPTVAVVGHGTALRTILEHIYCASQNSFPLHEQGECQVIGYTGV
jgi:glucosyl-3-phosphoglycerate phosphatase